MENELALLNVSAKPKKKYRLKDGEHTKVFFCSNAKRFSCNFELQAIYPAESNDLGQMEVRLSTKGDPSHYMSHKELPDSRFIPLEVKQKLEHATKLRVKPMMVHREVRKPFEIKLDGVWSCTNRKIANMLSEKA